MKINLYEINYMHYNYNQMRNCHHELRSPLLVPFPVPVSLLTHMYLVWSLCVLKRGYIERKLTGTGKYTH